MDSQSHSKSFNPNRHLKEQFVSNLDGSSMLEIAALLTTVPVIVLLRHSISSYRITDNGKKDASSKKIDDKFVTYRSWRDYMATITMDFMGILCPILLFFTVLAEGTYLWTILLTCLLVSVMVARRFTSLHHLKGLSSSPRTDISLYRVCMMIITCLCILAVDFKIFPRRYAKTETYGTSLMDLGVGSFVMANALVSRQARNVSSLNIRPALTSTSPLLLLGFGRLLSTVGVDYQVHVGEYGVHWNFFFTLAAVSILSSLINIPPWYCGILGLFILIGKCYLGFSFMCIISPKCNLNFSSVYQTFLVQGFNLYLLTSERGSDIISQNKEGIFSIFGYWGMYLVGVHLGNSLFFRKNAESRSKQSVTIRVWILTLLLWLLTILLDKHVERVSRRMCNLAYVSLVLATNFQALAILMLSDYVGGSKSSLLEDAFNRNLLGSFLLANILTGLVNLFVDALFSSPLTALLILSAYSYVLSVLTGFLDYYGIRLKFW